MLDEIDKLGSDFRGDPSSALLEVLDPEQNFSFTDHYLDVPFDLSHVMFITTANMLETIPPALRDRLEVIELLGYTPDEKLKIAERYLIPRQIDFNGLQPGQITFATAALKTIISGYTREAGVRNLEREIASICRGVASRVAAGELQSTSIKVKDIHRYLGPIRMSSESAARTSKPGVVMGLAWTPTGGELLFIEATAMKGKMGLTLTANWRRNEGIRLGGFEFYPCQCGNPGHLQRLFSGYRYPHPRSVRRHPQGRPVGRRHHPDSLNLAAHQ